MNVLTIINNIVGEQYVNMIKFRIHSGVLRTHLTKVSRESKILVKKITLNNYKNYCQIKRREKGVPCQAGNLMHQKITRLYPHRAGVDISA